MFPMLDINLCSSTHIQNRSTCALVHVHQDTAQQMRQLSLVHVTFSKHSISFENFDVMVITSFLNEMILA